MTTSLPFPLLPPCTSTRVSHCLPTNTRSYQWRARLQPSALPQLSRDELAYACGALRMRSTQPPAVRSALANATFWSEWLPSRRGVRNATAARRCVGRLAAWRPRVCQLERVFIATAAQLLFNASGYFAPAHRVAASLKLDGRAARRRPFAVEATLRHAVLSRNEYGAGFYHVLLDTLASLAFLWPVLRADADAAVLLNPCTTGREHLHGADRYTAPSLRAAQRCERRPYAAALLDALAVRYVVYPYTRQPRGPVVAAAKASFMCSHPFHATYHRNFWYIRRLREWVVAAFRLPLAPLAAASRASIVLIDRTHCGDAAAACDDSRGVVNHAELALALRRAFPLDEVRAFSGEEPFASQLALFRRADVLIGPHGAAFANSLVCRDGAALVEFHRASWQGRGERNSPLYVLLARLLRLQYWVVVDTTTPAQEKGYRVLPADVVASARAALKASTRRSARALFNANAHEAMPPHWRIEYPNWIDPAPRHSPRSNLKPST